MSGELGYTFLFEQTDKDHQDMSSWFIEPQVQLSYFQIKGKDWGTSTGISVRQDTVDSLIGRVGIVTGKTYYYGNSNESQKQYFQIAARTGVIHEFFGSQAVNLNSIYQFETDLGGTTYYYGIEGDWKFGENQRFYLNLDREEGSNYTKDLSVRLGYHLSF